MFSFFDDEVFRSHPQDFLSSFNERIFIRQLTCFRIIHGEYINQFDCVHQRIPLCFHPEIHGVHHDEFRTLVNAFDHLFLELWHEVAEHEEFTVLVRIRDDRVEVKEHIQLRVECITGIHVDMILPGPEKRLLSFFNLKSFSRHSGLTELFNRFSRKIVADNGNKFNVFSKIRCGGARIGRRSANDFIRFSKWCFDGIKGHRSNHNQAHEFRILRQRYWNIQPKTEKGIKF